METELLNMVKLFERMEDDRELIREVFEVFVEEAPGRRVKFEAALAGADQTAMIMLAHSLKGASGTLMAEPLQKACYELEHAARTGDAARIAEFTPMVLDLLEKTAAKMEALKPAL